jgi:adenylate cyclase
MIRRVRLISGLVMLAYVTMHLMNHSLGLVSREAMDAMLRVVQPVWTGLPGSIVLYGAFAVHYGLALWALWARRSLRMMPVAEAAQLVLGFSIPFLLVDHVLIAREASPPGGGSYTMMLLGFFVEDPPLGALQLAVLVIAWTHAMIGMWYWLRLRTWYERWQPVLYAFALLLPTLAAFGVFVAGREVAAAPPGPPPGPPPAIAGELPPPPPDRAVTEQMADLWRLGFMATLLGVLLARSARWYWQRRHGVITLTYPSGRLVQIPRGLSVLEASRLAGIPHASVCGGRGRCSTCRIRIEAHEAARLPPPSHEESRVLHRVGAAPNVRLACQVRPLGDMHVTPLLPPTAHARDGFRRPGYLHGVEREIVILFCDLRAFTQLTEKRLPYDVVFLLNRYFSEMGHAVETAGGQIDKFIGDGVMALFGLDSGVEAGCRAALTAARAMSERMQSLNHALAHDVTEPMKIGIGIHAGPAIVGEMGYGKAVSITAVGDTVNTASRIEGLTKDFGCELVVSEAVVANAGIDLGDTPRHEIEIRGRVGRLVVRTVTSAGNLPRLKGSAPAKVAAAAG